MAIKTEQINIFGNAVDPTKRKGVLKQAANPCPICGSYYRRGDKCNVCETDLKEPKEEDIKKKREFFLHGRFYSKTKKHRG